MSQRLLNKVAIITGASSGLGRAIALAYSREGAHVVCADLHHQARSQVQAETQTATDDVIRQQGGQAIFVKCDVSSAMDVEGMVKKTVEEFGRVDILVNNAGISLEAQNSAGPKRLHEVPEDWWDKTLDINSKSVFLGTKYVIPQMLSQEPHSSGHRGWIVNISSIYGLVGGRFNVAYATSKAAVINLTKCTSLDYAQDKIHCNAICPGFVKTAIFADTSANMISGDTIAAMHPWGTVGTPSDITGAAIFLASDEASWITGAALPVDGGFTAQ